MGKRYEYLVEASWVDEDRCLVYPGHTRSELTYLDGRGEDGWHLSAVVDADEGGGRDYYFARLLPEDDA